VKAGPFVRKQQMSAPRPWVLFLKEGNQQVSLGQKC
jgi:hypothetical protein